MCQLAQLVVACSAVPSASARSGSTSPGPHGARAGELERDDRVHEPLLGAVMQVAHHAPARVIARGEDSGARRGELIPAVRVGDRGLEQLGEAGHALLGVVGRRLAVRPDRRQHAPGAAVDDDRGARPSTGRRLGARHRRSCRWRSRRRPGARSVPCAARSTSRSSLPAGSARRPARTGGPVVGEHRDHVVVVARQRDRRGVQERGDLAPSRRRRPRRAGRPGRPASPRAGAPPARRPGAPPRL